MARAAVRMSGQSILLSGHNTKENGETKPDDQCSGPRKVDDRTGRGLDNTDAT